jgi:hypothetical protein
MSAVVVEWTLNSLISRINASWEVNIMMLMAKYTSAGVSVTSTNHVASDTLANALIQPRQFTVFYVSVVGMRRNAPLRRSSVLALSSESRMPVTWFRRLCRSSLTFIVHICCVRSTTTWPHLVEALCCNHWLHCGGRQQCRWRLT